MFIIDLDNTLIDTSGEFRKARIKDLKNLGISEKLYEKTYTFAVPAACAGGRSYGRSF